MVVMGVPKAIVGADALVIIVDGWLTVSMLVVLVPMKSVLVA
jgi:hypothetical protein